MIHRKKNAPALQRLDISTVSIMSFFFFSVFLFLIGNLLKSSSIKFIVVLFVLAWYTAPFSSRHFFFGLLLRFN